MSDKRTDERVDDGEPIDPGVDSVDPAPWLGQVGEGATLESGEAIAREIDRMTHPAREEPPASADPEVPPIVPDRE
jgi:hypothetical protein